jgi:hypothetical protein
MQLVSVGPQEYGLKSHVSSKSLKSGILRLLYISMRPIQEYLPHGMSNTFSGWLEVPVQRASGFL